jgi:DNA-binding response OmpR family regulator
MGASSKAVKLRSTNKIRVLVCSADPAESRRMVYFLNSNGFETSAVNNFEDLRDATLAFKPRVVIADLLLKGANAFEYLNFLRSEPRLAKTKVSTLIVSSHDLPHNVDEAFRRGASDYILRPVNYPDLLNRVVLHCREIKELEEPNKNDKEGTHWLLTEVLLTQALSDQPIEVTLHQLMRTASKKVGGIRASVIRTVTMTEASVIASNDDASVNGLKIDLNKYPEVRLVINTGRTIVIDDLANSRTLAAIKKATKTIRFNAMIVLPLFYRGTPFGVISMRFPENKKEIAESDVRFMEVLSKIVSLTLSAQDLKQISKFGLIPA